jgi:hypothetical protein
VTIPAGDQTGFIDITAGGANVLLSGATVTAVPESGSLRLLCIGLALLGVGRVQRALRARKTG